MRRAGKTTLPYAFCLLCAVLGLVLLTVGLPSVLAWRDARLTIPDRAEAALQAAIAPALESLQRQVDPVVRQLRLAQQWVAAGVFPEVAMRQWPAVLLPALVELEGLKRATLVKENGAYWQLARANAYWAAIFAEGGPGGDAPQASAWSDSGERLARDPLAPSSVPNPMLDDWFSQTLALEASRGGGLYFSGSLASDPERPTRLALPLQFPSGQRGCLALDVDLGMAGAAIIAMEHGPARVVLDPEGEIVHQLQDAQTLQLLQERAVPEASSAALSILMDNGARPDGKYWYRAGVYTLAPGASWWVLASVDEAALPAPALPLGRYLGWSLAAGAAGAVMLAFFLGRKITAPLRQVASRARNIQALDEHYLPWPESPFTEVNTLTAALEDIYESAVEHLDYHDAPLVVWAQPDGDPEDDTIVVEAVRHVMNIPRPNGNGAPAAPEEPAIPVAAAQDLVAARASSPAAAQLQVLHGTRREVRRLQGQLAGATEELRTTGARYEEGQLRMRQQRACLRSLHKVLQSEGAVSLAVIEPVRKALDASRVSLWIAGEQRTHFRLRLATGQPASSTNPLGASLRLRALLEEESCVAVYDPRNDSRLEELLAHVFLQRSTPSLLLAPVKLVGQLLGFLLVEHTGQPRRWKSDEELFITSVAAQCAGALWRQLRQQARAIAVAHVAQGRPAEPGGNGNGNGNGRRNGNGHKQGNGAANGSHPGAAAPEDVLRWETDLAGCLKRIEGDVAGIYGRTADQLLGQPVTFLSDAMQGQVDLERLSALLAGIPCTGYKTRHLASGGLPVDLIIDAELLRDANDRIVGARGTARCLRAPARA